VRGAASQAVFRFAQWPWVGLVGLAAIAVVAPACEPDPDVEPVVCTNPEPARAELGVGDEETGFQPLEDGDEFRIVLGPQGMHMLVVAVRLEHFELPTAASGQSPVRVAVRHGDQLIGGIQDTMTPSTISGDVVQFLGLRAVFTVAEIEPYIGEMATITVEIVDGCGRTIRATREVRLVQ